MRQRPYTARSGWCPSVGLVADMGRCCPPSGALATIDALPAIVAAVGKRVPVLMDGGIRRGTDIIKARAGCLPQLLGLTALVRSMPPHGACLHHQHS